MPLSKSLNPALYSENTFCILSKMHSQNSTIGDPYKTLETNNWGNEVGIHNNSEFEALKVFTPDEFIANINPSLEIITSILVKWLLFPK